MRASSARRTAAARNDSPSVSVTPSKRSQLMTPRGDAATLLPL